MLNFLSGLFAPAATVETIATAARKAVPQPRGDAWAYTLPLAKPVARVASALGMSKRDRAAWARAVGLDAVDAEIDQQDAGPVADRLEPEERTALIEARNRIAKLFRLAER